MNPYIASVFLILVLGALLFFFGFKRKLLSSFNVQELVQIALFCSLLYAAILPFKLGLGRIPFANSFFFAIPFTAVLVIGIRVTPRFGATTLILVGQSLLSQATSTGINPLWWPYVLLASFLLEGYFLVTGNYLQKLTNAIGAGILRGLVMNLYFYLFSAPYIWHQFYAPWFIFLQTTQGVIGSGIGAAIGFSLSRPIIRAYRQGGI